MKLIIKVLFVVLVIGVSGLFFIKRPDGQPWLSLNTFTPDLSGVKAKIEHAVQLLKEKTVRLSADDQSPAQKTQVYKWKRADGSWTYSDKPPPKAERLDVTVMILDSNTNIVPALKLPTETQKTPEQAAVAEEHKVPLPLSANPQQIKELVDDTNELQQLMEQRQESLQQY